MPTRASILLILCCLTSGLNSSAQEVFDWTEGNWQFESQFSYGISTVGAAGEGIPQGRTSRTAMAASAGLVKSMLKDMFFYGLHLTYYDRGIREDVFPGNEFLVTHNQGPSNQFAGVCGSWGFRIGRFTMESGWGIDFLVASEPPSFESELLTDIPPVMGNTNWVLGYEYRIADRLVMFNRAIMNMQLGPPNFLYFALSTGFRIVNNESKQGKAFYTDGQWID